MIQSKSRVVFSREELSKLLLSSRKSLCLNNQLNFTAKKSRKTLELVTILNEILKVPALLLALLTFERSEI